MSPAEEALFLNNFAAAMRRSEDARALEKLWADYSDKIAECSPETQKALHGLRAKRGCELMEER